MVNDKPFTREDIERLLQEAGDSSKLVLNGCNLADCDLSGLDLSYASLYGANLSGANLSQANMVQIKLDFANLSGANLSYASLRGANLSEANLCGADLSKVNLRGVFWGQAIPGNAEPSEVNQGNFVTNLFRGRINRSSYLVGSLAIYSVWLVTVLIFLHIPTNTNLVAIVVIFALLLDWVVVVLFSIYLTIRRFHDFNKSAFYLLWFLVHFINWYFGFLLLFERGTLGPNMYGPPPDTSIKLFH